MKKLILSTLILFSSISYGSENLHRLGGHYENKGKKFAVCISLLETFWSSRGVKAFNGYMSF